MGLRNILLVLSLLALMSASGGGILYYSALRTATFQEAEQQAAANTELIRNSLNALLSENEKAVETLAGMRALQRILRTGKPDDLYYAHVVLDHFQLTLGADVCYLMDLRGDTIASSNRKSPDSFVGSNFSFRPYFQQAVQGLNGAYLALGTTSSRRGVYHSYPIYDDPEGLPVGVAVIKSPIDTVEKAIGLPTDDTVLVTSPLGVIFISNRLEWLFHYAWQLSHDQLATIAANRQFGKGPWYWVGLRRLDTINVQDRQGRRYMMHQAELDRFKGWKIIHLRDMNLIVRSISGPLLKVVGPVVILLSLLICVSVLGLYRKASREIQRRRNAEQALRQSEARYRNLYHHTPAMLHSIDTQGRIVSVSDYWVEMLGYGREEVIGRPLTDFLTPDAKQHALETVMPNFFNHGFVKDVTYDFIKKDGHVIEVMLSAIADRDADGAIQRSLAVSIDMTARNRAEEALRIAKEALSCYSKELEGQVAKRTSEISSILKYTPAVVYMKDIQGRYLLVNSRYEELFGVRNETVRGKSDIDVLPPGVARQFGANDERVLAEGHSLHVEEEIEHEDGRHTYLSVKFPIYEESGKIRGVCGIATDITAAKKAREQLRRLSASIMANQEKERSAIARELHDELGQLLTALRLDAVWLQERCRKIDEQAGERAGAMCRLIDTTIEDVRGLAIRLRPGVLDDLGLVDALEWFTGDFERRTQISCILSHDAIPAVDSTVATVAYRIAQEALTNVARYAAAARVEVSLTMERDVLVLHVSDDGRGFNPDALNEAEALGLAGMRERASLVDGEFTVDSSPGHGTRLKLRVPLGSPPEGFG
jgi:PAS domain S-box-containing protein